MVRGYTPRSTLASTDPWVLVQALFACSFDAKLPHAYYGQQRGWVRLRNDRIFGVRHPSADVHSWRRTDLSSRHHAGRG